MSIVLLHAEKVSYKFPSFSSKILEIIRGVSARHSFTIVPFFLSFIFYLILQLKTQLALQLRTKGKKCANKENRYLLKNLIPDIEVLTFSSSSAAPHTPMIVSSMLHALRRAGAKSANTPTKIIGNFACNKYFCSQVLMCTRTFVENYKV